MYIEGFIRSLQGDFMATMGLLFAVGALYWLVRAAMKEAPPESSDQIYKAVNGVFSIVVTFVLIMFFGRAVAAGFSNRLPRQDVDRTSVYERMNNH